GFRNPVALGCPSMMLYSDNILGIRPLSAGAQGKKFVTAGYLSPQSWRGAKLARFFQDQDVSYVFQDEIADYKDDLADRTFFNDATGRVDEEIIGPLVSEALGLESPFRRYFWFDSVDAWRACYAWHDSYIGDRFHGGVAALQVGIPTAILHEDLRVKEMCEFF